MANVIHRASTPKETFGWIRDDDRRGWRKTAIMPTSINHQALLSTSSANQSCHPETTAKDLRPG
ncbi:MAG: hypothetical protein H0W49_15605 [Nitrospirales bacterium]|nr:hypothetical protein [Nitrospirales bacterium]MBA3964250.1 hypothetical protein [Nitrospirales bacterium]